MIFRFLSYLIENTILKNLVTEFIDLLYHNNNTLQYVTRSEKIDHLQELLNSISLQKAATGNSFFY